MLQIVSDEASSQKTSPIPSLPITSTPTSASAALNTPTSTELAQLGLLNSNRGVKRTKEKKNDNKHIKKKVC